LKLLEGIKAGVIIACFGGAILWTYDEAGFESRLCFLSSFIAILLFAEKLRLSYKKDFQLSEIYKLIFSTIFFGGTILWANISGVWGAYLTILVSSILMIYCIIPIKPSFYKSRLTTSIPEEINPNEDERLDQALSKLRSKFLITTDVVQLQQISRELSALKNQSAEALALYKMVLKAIRYHKEHTDYIIILMLVGVLFIVTTRFFILFNSARKLLRTKDSLLKKRSLVLFYQHSLSFLST
jgi:hypothetical protein